MGRLGTSLCTIISRAFLFSFGTSNDEKYQKMMNDWNFLKNHIFYLGNWTSKIHFQLLRRRFRHPYIFLIPVLDLVMKRKNCKGSDRILGNTSSDWLNLRFRNANEGFIKDLNSSGYEWFWMILNGSKWLERDCIGFDEYEVSEKLKKDQKGAI